VVQAKALDGAVVKLDIIEPHHDASVESCTRDDGHLGLISGKADVEYARNLVRGKWIRWRNKCLVYPL
jgi:hypothetical protein